MEIVSRREWGAKPPAKTPYAIATPTPELWLHHTAGSELGAAGMRTIQAFHMGPQRRWSDIAYSLVVDPVELVIYEGRGIGIAGGHTKGHNTISHAICVMGNFETRTASPALLRLLADLIRHGREQQWWRDLSGGHRQASGASTACPGRHLQAAIPEIRALAATATAPPTDTEDDDMSKPQELYTLYDPADPSREHIYAVPQDDVVAHHMGEDDFALAKTWEWIDKTAEPVRSTMFHCLDGPLRTP